jgi:hypothetical protein
MNEEFKRLQDRVEAGLSVSKTPWIDEGITEHEYWENKYRVISLKIAALEMEQMVYIDAMERALQKNK